MGSSPPRRVGAVQLECAGEGREPGRSGFPKSVRGSSTFQRTHPCLPQAHLPLPSLHSSALVFNMFSCFSCVACSTTGCLRSHVRGGRGWADGQPGRLPPAVDENLGSGKGQMQAAVTPSLWAVGLWLSPLDSEARFSHLIIGMTAATGSEGG